MRILPREFEEIRFYSENIDKLYPPHQIYSTNLTKLANGGFKVNSIDCELILRNCLESHGKKAINRKYF